MNKYDRIQRIGQGSYGTVIKCRHRETGRLVAIKKSLDTEDNPYTKKAALREIKMLQKLHHDNIVNLIEAFLCNKRYHLVLEYMDHTLLREIEECKDGLGAERTREYFFQIAQGVGYCHSLRMLHRDVKPENILVSRHGVVKLCDFGLARRFVKPNDTISVEVGTQYYNAPELLIKATDYGCEVDVWAMGCVFAEMMNGKPLFQGEIGSEIDQLHIVMTLLGQLPPCYEKLLNPRAYKLTTMKKHLPDEVKLALSKLFPTWSPLARDLLQLCIKLDPSLRPRTHELLKHPYFITDNFVDKFSIQLKGKIRNIFSNVSLVDRHKPTDHGDGLPPPAPDRFSRRVKSHSRGENQKGVARKKTTSPSRDLKGLNNRSSFPTSHHNNEYRNGPKAINIDKEVTSNYSQAVKVFKIPKLKIVQKQKKPLTLKPKRIPSQLFQRFKSRLNKKLTPSAKSKAIATQFSSGRCNNEPACIALAKTQSREANHFERMVSLKPANVEKIPPGKKHNGTQGFMKPFNTHKQVDPRNCHVSPYSVKPNLNMQKLTDIRKCYGAKPSVKSAQKHTTVSIKPKILPRLDLMKLNRCSIQPASIKAQKGKKSNIGIAAHPYARVKEPKKITALPRPQWRY